MIGGAASMRWPLAAALAGLLLASRAGVAATPGDAPSAPPARAGGEDHRTPDQLRNEVFERMRALRAWRIVEALKLDEATSGKLFPIFAKYDQRDVALAAERRDVIHELRAASDAARPEDVRISKAIDRLVANRARQRALDDERVRDLRKVLTPVQQAKLVLLLPRLEHDFAHWVHEVSGHHEPGDE